MPMLLYDGAIVEHTVVKRHHDLHANVRPMAPSQSTLTIGFVKLLQLCYIRQLCAVLRTRRRGTAPVFATSSPSLSGNTDSKTVRVVAAQRTSLTMRPCIGLFCLRCSTQGST